MEYFTVGLDLGSFKTSIVASNGQRAFVESVVGWPRDQMANRTLARKVRQKTLGEKVLFGRDVHADRMALNVVRPCEKAMLKFQDPQEAGLSEEEIAERKKAIRLLLEHVVGLVEPPKGARIRAVMGSPSCSSPAARRTMIEAAESIFESVIVIPEPFAVVRSGRAQRNPRHRYRSGDDRHLPAEWCLPTRRGSGHFADRWRQHRHRILSETDRGLPGSRDVVEHGSRNQRA